MLTYSRAIRARANVLHLFQGADPRHNGSRLPILAGFECGRLATARTCLSKVLVKTAHRDSRPISVAETSWHDGHREQQRPHPGMQKGEWLRHVLAGLSLAPAKSAEAVGVCWSPIGIAGPGTAPGVPHRWSQGLISADLGVDLGLAAAFAERMEPTGPLGFDFGARG